MCAILGFGICLLKQNETAKQIMRRGLNDDNQIRINFNHVCSACKFMLGEGAHRCYLLCFLSIRQWIRTLLLIGILTSTGGNAFSVKFPLNCHLPTLSANYQGNDKLKFIIHVPSDFCLSFVLVGEKLLCRTQLSSGQVSIRTGNYVSDAAKSFLNCERQILRYQSHSWRFIRTFVQNNYAGVATFQSERETERVTKTKCQPHNSRLPVKLRSSVISAEHEAMLFHFLHCVLF